MNLVEILELLIPTDVDCSYIKVRVSKLNAPESFIFDKMLLP